MLAKKMSPELFLTIVHLRSFSSSVSSSCSLTAVSPVSVPTHLPSQRRCRTFNKFDSKSLFTWVVLGLDFHFLRGLRLIISVTTNQKISTLKVMTKNKDKFVRK